MRSIDVVAGRCVGCALCVPACPYGSIRMEGERALIDDSCVLCGACVGVCPYGAILLAKGKAVGGRTEGFRGVWVLAEQRNGTLCEVSFELLGAGRKLADAVGADLGCVLMGNGVETAAPMLIARGADRVYVVDSPLLERFVDESYARVLTRLIREGKPEIFLGGATSMGRALIPRVAAGLGTGLTADCTGLAIDLERSLLLQTRPAFGGNIMATIVCRHRRPQMATVRHRVMKPLPSDPARRGEVVRVDPERADLKSRTRVLRVVGGKGEEARLFDAEVIIAGGRGVGGRENFRVLESLAAELHGAVAASRYAVDAGWISYDRQVGQTGKTVHPRLYIACGISGAAQHLVGMQSSDVIVAVNRDPEAPIMRMADFALVGDLFEVVPSLTLAVRKARQKARGRSPVETSKCISKDWN